MSKQTDQSDKIFNTRIPLTFIYFLVFQFPRWERILRQEYEQQTLKPDHRTTESLPIHSRALTTSCNKNTTLLVQIKQKKNYNKIVKFIPEGFVPAEINPPASYKIHLPRKVIPRKICTLTCPCNAPLTDIISPSWSSRQCHRVKPLRKKIEIDMIFAKLYIRKPRGITPIYIYKP